MKWKGKLFGLPDYTGTSVMYLNKKLFDEAGVPYPTYDWTWDTLVEQGRRLRQRFPEGSGVFGIVPFVEDIRWAPYYYWSLGGTIFEGSGPMAPDETVVKVHTPQNIKGLQAFVDWITRHGLAPRPGDPAYRNAWPEGRLAMNTSGRFAVPGWANYDWIMQHGAMTLPPRGTARRRSRTTARGTTVPSGVKDVAEAWEAVKFITGPKGAEILVSAQYTQPVRKSAQATFARTLFPFENHQVYLDSERFYTDPVPNHARWNEAEVVVREETRAAVQGEKGPDQALRDMQQRLQLLMKRPLD